MPLSAVVDCILVLLPVGGGEKICIVERSCYLALLTLLM